MFWEEDKEPAKKLIDDSVVDLLFTIDCRELPVDHIHSLSVALRENLPHFERGLDIGVHEIHLAGSQNGWERPDENLGQHLILSHRTKLTLRVPRDYAEEISAILADVTLDIEGFPLTIRKSKTKKLSTQGTVFSRHIICSDEEIEDEMLFMQRMQAELSDLDIQVKKALCGKISHIKTPEGPIHTRSLMLAELTSEQSVRLQQKGLRHGRDVGCGLFIPHKGIEAVGKSTDDE